MNQDEVLAMFRQYAQTIPLEAQGPMLSGVINELAQLLADSRGEFRKESFETLARIGGVLYRQGESQYQARTDLKSIMKESQDNREAQ